MPWNDDVPSTVAWRTTLRDAANTYMEDYRTTFFGDSPASRAQEAAANEGVRLLRALTQRLDTYNLIPKDQLRNRIAALSLLIQACYELGEAAATTPADTYVCNAARLAAVRTLAGRARTKRSYLDQVAAVVDAGLPSLTDVLDRRYSLAALTGTHAIGLDSHYWIEQTHPAHATTQVSRSLGTLFGEWERAAREGRTQQHFYVWLEHDGRLATVQEPAMQVEYLQAADLRAFTLAVRAGRVVRARSREDLTLVPYDTTGFDDADMATFVIAPDQTVYSGRHERGLFHHSTFLAGGKVLCAGMISVINGQTRVVTPKSGHYKAPMRDFLRGLDLLERAGIIDRTVRVDLEFWKNLYVEHVPVEQLRDVLDARGRMKLPLADFRDWAADQVRASLAKTVAWAREQDAAHRASQAEVMAYMLILKRFHIALFTMMNVQSRLGLTVQELERNITESHVWAIALGHRTHPLNPALAVRVLRVMAFQVKQRQRR